MPAFTNQHVLSTVNNYLIPHFERVSSDLTKRERLLFAKMGADGRIKLNSASAEIRLPAHWKESTPVNFTAGSVMTYSPVDRLTHFVFNLATYGNTDMITHLEEALAKGPDALVDRAGEILTKLGEDLAKTLGADLYIDGYASGNEHKLLGLNSYSGTGTTVVGDIVAKPDDSYGGRDTDVGSYAGTWSTNLTGSAIPNASIATDWPWGKGSTQYDHNSPKLFNWSSTAWPSGASNAFINTAAYTIRAMITALSRLGGRADKPTLVIMSSKMFVDFKNLMDDAFRNLLPHEEARDLGFPTDVLNYDGLMVTSDYDCPDNELHMINTNKLEWHSAMPELIWSIPPAYESGNLSKNYIVGHYGQLVGWCKFQGKAKNYAAS